MQRVTSASPLSPSERADRLRRLHHGPDVLVLPNAWDCASARIFEEAGFPAIATTSAGIAFSLGYPDGERIPRTAMLDAVGRIARVVSVPVTADLEAGYDDIELTAAGLVASGAVGLNVEDIDHATRQLVPIDRQLEKLAAVRRVGDSHGVPLVINARTDVFLARIGEPQSRVARACERLAAYRDAGADCLFAPGVVEEAVLAALVETLQFPINVLAMAGTPPIARLKAIGVARVSVGSGIMRATMGLARRVAEDLRRDGTYDTMLEGAVPFADANRLFDTPPGQG